MNHQIRILCNSKIVTKKSNGENVLRSWKVQIRSTNSSVNRLESFIDHVEYWLHPSFKESRIVCMHEPYIIQQEGWGEFDMLIVLYFRDVSIPPKKINFELHFRRPKYSIQRTLDIPGKNKKLSSIKPSNLVHPPILPKPSTCNDNNNNSIWSMSVLCLDIPIQKQHSFDQSLPEPFDINEINNDANLSRLSNCLRSLNDHDLRKFYNLLSQWDLKHLGIIETQDEIVLDLSKFTSSELLIVWKFVMNLNQYKDKPLLCRNTYDN